MSVTDNGRRSVDSSFLDEKVSETEEFWQRLVDEGRIDEVEEGIRMRPVASDVEEFTRITEDANFAHIKGLEPERSTELSDMLEQSTQYTSPEVPEGYEDAGEYRPLQQGALTPTAIAYDPRLGFDGLLTNLELSFEEPVFAGVSTSETADATTISGEEYEVAAENPWVGETYNPTVVDYETEGEGDFTEENRRRVALLNTLVARGPLENGRSPRDGDIFHEAEADYPTTILDGSDFEYAADGDQEITDTALGPMKVFEVEDELGEGGFSYTETYIDADV